jgi:negative regulator of sigma E activity
VAVTGQDLDDHDDDDESASSEQPWHNRTPAVLGASAVGLVVISILVLAVSYLIRQFSEQEQAPLNFVDPTFSATQTESTSQVATTTATATTTSVPQTTDLPPAPPPSSSSETSRDESTARRNGDDDDTDRTTTRKRPRTNVTRTVQPFTP